MFFHKKVKIEHNNKVIYSKKITHHTKNSIVLAEAINMGEIEGEVIIKFGMYKKIKISLNNNEPYIYLTKIGFFSPLTIEQTSKQKKYR